jgi:hypothetical protein
MLDLAYVGAGVAASAVAMDKRLCKELHRAAGLPVLDFWAVSRGRWTSDREAVLERLARAPIPLFVKPSVGGSSVGIRRVDDRAGLAEAIDFALGFDDNVLIERGAVGARELEVAVLGYPDLEAATAVGEIVPGNDFYDYADKYLSDNAKLIAPAELDEAVEAGDPGALEHELGDVLFAAANLGRKLGIPPEEALRGAVSRFIARFSHVERELARRGVPHGEATLAEMDALWDEAKDLERQAKSDAIPRSPGSTHTLGKDRG